MEILTIYHDIVIELLICVLVVVFIGFVLALRFLGLFSYCLRAHWVEFFWTVDPAFLLGILAVPSILFLYFVDESGYSFQNKVFVKGFQ